MCGKKLELTRMLWFVTCGPKTPPGIDSVVQVLVSLLFDGHGGGCSDAEQEDWEEESCSADLHQCAGHPLERALFQSSPAQSSARLLLWQEALMQTEGGLNILMSWGHVALVRSLLHQWCTLNAVCQCDPGGRVKPLNGPSSLDKDLNRILSMSWSDRSTEDREEAVCQVLFAVTEGEHDSEAHRPLHAQQL